MKRAVVWVVIFGMCLTFLGGCGKKKEDSLSSSPPSSSSSESSSLPVVVSKTVKIAVVKGAEAGLRVRAEASSDGDVLTIADNDEKFRLAKEEAEGDWYEIIYKGEKAYLSKEYVDVKEISEEDMLEIEASVASKDESTDSENGESSSSSESSASSGSVSSDSSKESSDKSGINTRDDQDVE